MGSYNLDHSFLFYIISASPNVPTAYLFLGYPYIV